MADTTRVYREANDFTDMDFSSPGNWIALSRDVINHPVVGAGQTVKPANLSRGAFSRMEAWIDLLALAQYKPARINNKGEVMTLDVGQLRGGREFLAERWNWTEKTVRGYLSVLEAENMISRVDHSGLEKGQQGASRKSNKCTVLTISNYYRYQFIAEAIENYLETHKGQQRASEGPAKGHILTRKTRKQDSPPLLPPAGDVREEQAAPDEKSKRAAPRPKPTASQFDRFWAVYPKRVGKAKAQDRFRALSPEQAELAIEAAAVYAAEVTAKRTEDRYVKWAEGWLNSRRFEDLAPAAGAAGGVDAVYENLVSPDGRKRWGWWRTKADDIRAFPIDRWREAIKAFPPNGTWPWWVLGPPPGHKDCLMPDELIREKGYLEIYGGKIHHA